MTAISLLHEILPTADIEKAKFLQKNFKTRQGEYAKGDIMLGLSIPMVRGIVKKSPNLPFSEIQTLLDSKYHEVQLTGLLFLVKQFRGTK